ncbi:hypothetical protein PCANC_04338 [Puccinia coronata f. sp. avenae]|uniref:UDP-N-acetylglucosamine transferase subunit ALG14 n=1 Tax=Puccinia coronata f. sp. avenae TaxID=200324 RepID=A0A2N5VMW2_9BASI|nr:hypothetical protein PCANC_21129 [Puccinia coronata f. sp. avenae]PLW51307.1 hypothetical protein PCASD_00984 [Puccinia coronata f. sp. avenae]PLW53641.1 hypothetical protein PCANC_04338 [Puccinia coronata f. sp. avenae]
MTISMGPVTQIFGLFSILVFIFLVRLIGVIRSAHQRRSPPTSHSSGRSGTCNLTVLLGSGGHTGEMIRLLAELPFERYTPRTYIISSADLLSRTKAIELEQEKQAGQYTFLEIPRARKVNQSFATSVFTTIKSLLVCLWYISIKPNFAFRSVTSESDKDERSCLNAVLLNGPGSAVPIALSAFLSRLLTGKHEPRLIYVESLARVKRVPMGVPINEEEKK